MATTEDAIRSDPRKLRLLEWLTTPKEQRTQSQNKLAEELGVSPRTIRDWKADATFRALWEKEAKDIIGEPEKVAEVIEEMRQLALDRTTAPSARVSAAKVYLEAVDGIKPPAVDLAAKKAAELSDAELQALIAQVAQQELAERR